MSYLVLILATPIALLALAHAAIQILKILYQAVVKQPAEGSFNPSVLLGTVAVTLILLAVYLNSWPKL